MGEYADDHIDQMFNDYDRDYDDVDEFGSYGAYGCYARRRPQIKACQRCGQGGLVWIWAIPGRWVLGDPGTSEPHACPPASPSDFEPLPPEGDE